MSGPPHRRGNGPPQPTPSAEIQLRIPRIEGVPDQVLMQLAQGLLHELRPWVPLRHPQELADAVSKAVGDSNILAEVQRAMITAPRGHTMAMTIYESPKVQIGVGQASSPGTPILRLEAPCRYDECRTMDQTACFLTIAGLITSPVLRCLLTLENRYAIFDPPFTLEPDAPTEQDA